MKRTLPTLLLVSAGALACLLLSACGGSSSATPSPTPAPTATLSASDLARLVLPVQTLTVGGVELDLDSSQRAADES